MKIYLAGTSPPFLETLSRKTNILESFAYMNRHRKEVDLLLKNNFMLDSGAFTFMGNKKLKIDWDKYTNDYCDFINEYKIELFFELDIYSVIGTKATERLTKLIEKKTNKQSIPVWHISLGIDYYKRMVEEYDYIAIGASGRNDSKWTRTNPEKLKALVLYAKGRGTKVHGLGYTVIKQLKKIPFFSVDSTTWLNAGKYGEYQHYSNGTIKKLQGCAIGKKSKREESIKMTHHNFEQWIKFQDYAEKKL